MTFEEYIHILYADCEDSPKNRDFHENLRHLTYAAADCDFTYKFDQETISKLKKDIRLPIISGKDTFTRMVASMDWVTAHTQYCGYSSLGPSTLDTILDFGLDRGFDGAINCANKAILLSDVLLANDIFAMPIWLENKIYDYRRPTFGESTCHVIVHAYLPEREKWVLLDPSFHTYFTDKSGNLLNLFEVSGLSDTPRNIRVCNYNLNGTDKFAEKYLEAFLLKSLYIISVFGGLKKLFFLSGGLYTAIPCRYKEECAKILSAAKTSTDDDLKNIADRLSWNHQPIIDAHDLLKKPEIQWPCETEEHR